MDQKKKEELKKKLDPQTYQVVAEKGTEIPFSGKYVNHNERGMYTCVVCGSELFDSKTKYDSQTPGLMGWPSFSDVVKSGAVELKEDNSLGMRRTEVVCKHCGAHLGHVFDADDSSTGKHYCINSCSLDFKNNVDSK